jgi:hypothetical protein
VKTSNLACKNLVEKSQGKRPLGRHRHRLKSSIIMDISKIASEDMN